MNVDLSNKIQLTEQEIETLERHTKNIHNYKGRHEQTIIDDIRAFKDFWNRQTIDDKAEVIIKIISVYSETINRNMGLGMVIGGVIGGGVGGASSGGAAVVPGALTGMAYGGVTGALLGLATACSIVTIQCKKTQLYENWKHDAKSRDVYTIYLKIIHNDESFEDFLCLITGDFANIPVRDPDDHVYEKAAIEGWIDQKEIEIGTAIMDGASDDRIKEMQLTTCPLRSRHLTKFDLKFDPTYYKNLNDAIIKKLHGKGKEDCEKFVREGLEALIAANKEQRRNIVSSHIGQIFMRCQEDNLPKIIADEAVAKVMKKYKEGNV